MNELSEVAQEWLKLLGEFRTNNSGTAGWVMRGKSGSLDWTMTAMDWQELESVCAEVKNHLHRLNDTLQ